AGSDAVISCAAACSVYGLAYSSLITAYGFDEVPRTLGLIQPILLFLVLSSWRVLAGWFFSLRHRRSSAATATPALIYGAGVTGRQLAQALATSNELKVIGFVDDDRSLHNSRIGVLPVFEPGLIEACVQKF